MPQEAGVCCLDLFYRPRRELDDVAAGRRRDHKLGAAVVWVRSALDVAKSFEPINELAHRRRPDLCPASEGRQPRATRVEVGEDGAVLWAQTAMTSPMKARKQLSLEVPVGV